MSDLLRWNAEQAGHASICEDPLYSYYNRLHYELAPVEVHSEDSAMVFSIAMYLQNKHAATRSQYPADIDQVFRVSREGENEHARLTQSPSNYCSTKGVGGTAPNLSDAKTLDDGAVVPLGKPEEKQGTESD
ncbi:hypothetical protein POTOM_034921 [Populus tomentosa]|uniref:NAD(+) ADP-ribosyltransferase n=1 Tax=Populus tomentosa TaxID=118781 RepID=A0A8X8CPS1_POPTO|nr:hypothetical protein POTOM_034921 [Populus tomentosa]